MEDVERDLGAEAAPETTPTPFLGRVVDTFFSPAKLGKNLREHPAWAAALCVGAALVILQVVLIPAEVWETVQREAALRRGVELPQGFAMSGTIMRVGAVLGGGIFYFVFTFLVAGLTTLLFAFILGDEGRYKQYLAVLAHAWLIPTVFGLFMLPLKIIQKNPQLTLNLGNFFFFLPEGYLHRVLTMLDLTQLWAWLVVAAGAHAIDSKRSFTSAAILLVGLGVAFAMIFALFVPQV